MFIIRQINVSIIDISLIASWQLILKGEKREKIFVNFQQDIKSGFPEQKILMMKSSFDEIKFNFVTLCLNAN